MFLFYVLSFSKKGDTNLREDIIQARVQKYKLQIKYNDLSTEHCFKKLS